VATPRSSFGLPEARLGILPAAGGLHRLVRRTGEGTARRLMLTGQRIDGQRAAALGIVDDLAEPGGCLAHARALAGDLASLPPAALTAIKALTNTASDRTMEDGLAAELASWLQIRDSAETRAALTAALERSTGRGGPERSTGRGGP
jgi:enoyl-CoA hydratase/carnithine racemase